MAYQFEKLEAWKLALDYLDQLFDIAEKLPNGVDRDIRAKLTTSATALVLSIAEGSLSHVKSEQIKLIGDGIRSLVESVGCLHIIKRRNWVADVDLLRRSYRHSQALYGQLLGMRRAVDPESKSVRGERAERMTINDDPWPDE